MVEPVVNHSVGKSLLLGVSVAVLCLRCLTCADIQTGSCLPGYSTSLYFHIIQLGEQLSRYC